MSAEAVRNYTTVSVIVALQNENNGKLGST